jgi:hypothetical protein
MGAGADTLAETPRRRIGFICQQCNRRGNYKRETLLKEFGPDITLPSLLLPFAHSRGCPLAGHARLQPVLWHPEVHDSL